MWACLEVGQILCVSIWVAPPCFIIPSPPAGYGQCTPAGLQWPEPEFWSPWAISGQWNHSYHVSSRLAGPGIKQSNLSIPSTNAWQALRVYDWHCFLEFPSRIKCQLPTMVICLLIHRSFVSSGLCLVFSLLFWLFLGSPPKYTSCPWILDSGSAAGDPQTKAKRLLLSMVK